MGDGTITIGPAVSGFAYAVVALLAIAPLGGWLVSRVLPTEDSFMSRAIDRLAVAVYAGLVFVLLAGVCRAEVPDPPAVVSEVADPPAVSAACECLAGGPCECAACDCAANALVGLLTLAQPGCVGGNCSLGASRSYSAPVMRYTLAAPVYYAPDPLPIRPDASGVRAAVGHTHTCSHGHTWDHTQDGGSHRCPWCGEAAYVQSSARFVSAGGSGQTYGGQYATSFGAAVPVPSYSSGAVFYGADGGCSSGGMSAGAFAAGGRQPLMRVRGGPGVFRGLFGARGGCR